MSRFFQLSDLEFMTYGGVFGDKEDHELGTFRGIMEHTVSFQFLSALNPEPAGEDRAVTCVWLK